MASPTLKTHVLETPSPKNAWEFQNWESLNRPAGRLLMQCFHPEGTEGEPHHRSDAAADALDEGSQERFSRWVCVYEAYDEVTWGLIND